MLADPDINLTVFVHPEQGNGMLYAYEVCDACQDDEFGYEIDGVMVCDFLYPAYFQTFRQPGSTKFDHLSKLSQPVPAVLNGGYISAFDVNGSTGWHQQTAATVDPAAGVDPAARVDPAATVDPVAKRALIRGRTSSRRERRRMPRSQWVHSTAFKPPPK